MNISNVPYDKEILIDENRDTKQKVYFSQTLFTPGNTSHCYNHYFIKIYK